jgi:hypothetical protein
MVDLIAIAISFLCEIAFRQGAVSSASGTALGRIVNPHDNVVALCPATELAPA